MTASPDTPADTPAETTAETTPGSAAGLAADRPSSDDEDGRRLRGPAGDVVVVLGIFVVLGLLTGVLWWLLAPSPEFTKVRGGGTMDEVGLGRQFGAVAWYVAIATMTGLISGIALTWWRDRDPLLLSGLLLIGSVVAALLMGLVGHALGPGDPQAVLATARIGTKVPDQLHVEAHAAYLAWPVSVLVGALLILWGRLPADEPTDEPG